jgi:hypothetical protein
MLFMLGMGVVSIMIAVIGCALAAECDAERRGALSGRGRYEGTESEAGGLAA